MDTYTTIRTFTEFFRDRGHQLIEGSSLVPPDGDPVMFTTAGMQPLTRYLEGEPRPLGRRLAGIQRCLRTTDLDEVGDRHHLTVFQMLGSWSLGDYGGPQSLRWGLERLMMVSHGARSVYETDVFFPWLSVLHDLWQPETRSLRIITDHLRSAIAVIGDGVQPSNTRRGYVLRRLLRLALTELWRGDRSRTLADLPDVLVQDTLTRFGPPVPPGLVRDLLLAEEHKFGGVLSRGRSLLQRLYPDGQLTEDDYSYLHATHGLPRELVTELASGM